MNPTGTVFAAAARRIGRVFRRIVSGRRKEYPVGGGFGWNTYGLSGGRKLRDPVTNIEDISEEEIIRGARDE